MREIFTVTVTTEEGEFDIVGAFPTFDDAEQIKNKIHSEIYGSARSSDLTFVTIETIDDIYIDSVNLFS